MGALKTPQCIKAMWLGVSRSIVPLGDRLTRGFPALRTVPPLASQSPIETAEHPAGRRQIYCESGLPGLPWTLQEKCRPISLDLVPRQFGCNSHNLSSRGLIFQYEVTNVRNAHDSFSSIRT